MIDTIKTIVFLVSFGAAGFFAIVGAFDRAIFSTLFCLTYLMVILMMKFNNLVDQIQQLIDRPIVANIDQANWNMLMMAVATSLKRVGLQLCFEKRKKRKAGK